MQITKNEKRLHPRIDHCLPVKVAVNGYDFSTTTQNLSCLGAYCTINKYVPPFTKVMVKMDVPLKEGSKKFDINCKGVIVRSEDGVDGGFNIAIFFNAIPETQRKKISQYVERFLPEASASRQ